VHSEVWLEQACDSIRGRQRKFLHLASVRVATRQGSSDVEVDVWDRLIGSDTVVLPDRYPRTTVRRIDGSSCDNHLLHYRGSFRRREVQDRLAVSNWYDKDVPATTLLAGHQSCSVGVAPKDSELSPTGQVVAEGTAVYIWHLNVVLAHDGLNDAKNDPISSMSSFPTSCFRTTMSNRSQTRSVRDANMNDRAVSRIASCAGNNCANRA
jgi:hypothetical protein